MAKVVDFQLVAVEVQHVAVLVDPTRTAAETVGVAAHLLETKTDSRVIAVETVVAGTVVGSRMVVVVEPLVGCPYICPALFFYAKPRHISKLQPCLSIIKKMTRPRKGEQVTKWLNYGCVFLS